MTRSTNGVFKSIINAPCEEFIPKQLTILYLSFYLSITIGSSDSASYMEKA